ncbi:MAG: sodium/proton-translocating pyrophosphatase [Microthrixaceae bacterium]
MNVGIGEAAKGIIFPLAIMAIGLLASAVSIFAVKARPGETNACPDPCGVLLASIITLAGAAIVSFGYVGNPTDSAMSNVGLPALPGDRRRHRAGPGGQPHRSTTSSTFKPVRDIAESGRTGPATVVLSGISSGARVGRVGRRRHRQRHPGVDRHRWRRHQVLALPGGPRRVGMLATTGIIVAEDTFPARSPTTPRASPRWPGSSKARRR